MTKKSTVIPRTPNQKQVLGQLMDLHTDDITSVLAKVGVDANLVLTPQESYSEKTRKRAYWPRVQKAFREIPEDYRDACFALLTDVLLDQKRCAEQKKYPTLRVSQSLDRAAHYRQKRRSLFSRSSLTMPRHSPESDGTRQKGRDGKTRRESLWNKRESAIRFWKASTERKAWLSLQIRPTRKCV
jgi:hypothetical protein